MSQALLWHSLILGVLLPPYLQCVVLGRALPSLKLYKQILLSKSIKHQPYKQILIAYVAGSK